MGMSTYIIAIKPADDTWRKMKAIYDACKAAKVEVPDEVSEYFNGEPPNEKGVAVDLHFNDYDINDKRNHPAISVLNDNGRIFWDVELEKLPPDVKIVRFVNSW